MSVSEHDIQIAVARYLDAKAHYEKNWLFFHAPNSIHTSKAQAGKHKAYGMKAGVPDCVICKRGGETVFIELKTKKGAMSEKQRGMKIILEDLGYKVHVVHAHDQRDAIDQVEAILHD